MKTAKFTFYCHTCKVNGKPYVGQTLVSMEKRWAQHMSSAKRQSGGSPLFEAAIRKYGPDAFDHEVLEAILTTQEDANLREAKWILKKKSLSPNGYNLIEGGRDKVGRLVKKKLAAMSPEQRAELFKKTIHKDGWTPERIARQLAALRSEKAAENRKKVGPLRSEKMQSFQRNRQASLTPEQKSEIAKRAWETRRKNFSEEAVRQQQSRATSRSWANLSPEARAERARKMTEGRRGKMSPEAATARAEKVWATRVAKYGPLGHKLDAELVQFVRHWRDLGYSVESIASAFQIANAEVERVTAA